MAYSFEQVFAVDPSNPDNVANGASVLIFAPGDPSMTPLTITTPDGAPLANPIPTNANGFGSAFAHETLDRVAWAGGGFTGFFTSYEGMKQVAVAAAQSASESLALVHAPTDDQVDAGIVRADLPGMVAEEVPSLVQAQVPPLVASQVPPLVASSIASDPTVAQSAATMAQSTAGLVPVWKASTAYAAGQRVVAPSGDIVSAKVTFTSGATYSAANWNASGQDGRIGAVETTAVFNGDQRLLTIPAELEELSFGIHDPQDRRTWIESNKAGKPTAYSTSLIGEAVGYQTVPLDGGNGFAVVDNQDRIVFAPNRPHPVPDWAHWGDSMTDDEVTGADSWTVQMSALTGRNHFNGGWYQQKSDQIAARMGALPALVTLTGNATAASGGTVVTSITNSPVLYSTTRYVRGTLAGIPGSLQHRFTDTVMFYPDTPGIFPVPARSQFIPADGLALRDRHVTIWTGRNDVYSTDPQLVVAAVQQMIEYVSTDVKRVLVFEVPPSTADGTNGKPLTAAINTALKAAFPAYWLPIASWLRTEAAATAAGITFTAQDLTDIANGDTPTSFRLDSVHINAAGCKAVAFRVHQEAQKRGWL